MQHRVIALVLALPIVMLVGAFIALLWSERALDVGSASTLNMSGQLTGTDEAKWVATAIAGGIGLLALVLAGIEWWPSRGSIQLEGTSNETIRLPISALKAAVERDARDVSRVEDADATVHRRKEGVAVSIRLTAQPDAEVRSLIDEVAERVATGLTRRYGVELTQRPDVEMQYPKRRWWHFKRGGDGTPAA